MSVKEIHIVFQVLNFLHSDAAKSFKLFPIDKLLLITLASHKGIKGIFPMQETLADELDITRRYLRARIRHLEKEGFLFVEKVGRRHFYHLTNLSTKEEPQFPCHEQIGEPQFRSQGNYSSAHRGTTDARNNKVSNKVNKTERARKKTALALTEDFEPSEETAIKAKELGFKREECEIEFEKFMNYYLDNGAKKINWQRTLQNWFIKGAEWKKAHPVKPKQEEVRSTVPWFKPEDANRGERGAAPIGKLLNGLATKAREHLDAQGGKPNGLGSQGQGEKTKG